MIHSLLGNKYIKCSRSILGHVGIPFRHMFCVTDGELDVNMIDVRWWKAFHKHYREDSSIGTFLICCCILKTFTNTLCCLVNCCMKAQQACIDTAKHGCPISDHCYDTVVNHFNEIDNKVSYEGTSVNDFKLALKVMEMKCCPENNSLIFVLI